MANRSFPVHVRSSSRPITVGASDEPKPPEGVILDEILKRLPVESLLRCRGVCRSWRTAIDDPRFVALHLNHSALDASNWYILYLGWHHECLLFSNESLTLPSESQIEIPFATPHCSYSIVGSCNGLICITESSRYKRYCYFETMYLWNLFTRKHKLVPQSGVENQSLPFSAGFGFDARSNDYKIVRIFSGTNSLVEIYSLCTDSWRSLECGVPALLFCEQVVFLNGNLHWFASKVNDLGEDVGYGHIVLFDVAGEVFDKMALPPVEISQPGTVDIFMMFVAVLDDLLAVLVCLTDIAVGEHSVCSVWVMREYGLIESWTKLYSFEARGIVSFFDGFTRNGELLMVIDDEGVSWNPITRQYTDLPELRYHELATVVESLVSPSPQRRL